MSDAHPAIRPGATAVVTGAASGLGLAAVRKLAGHGMNVWLVDRSPLSEAAAAVRDAAPGVGVEARELDVSDAAAVTALADDVFNAGSVSLLMNNAGVGSGGSALERPDDWRRVLRVNLYGVLNGVQAFGSRMVAQSVAGGGPAAIVNTGSKQGITTPPGDTAYNVSKAGVKVLTEGLAHSLRETPGCEVSAHLFVPGFVWTGLTSRGRAGEKPPGAWTPDQTVDHLFSRMAAGDFYILCPDGETTSAMDRRRVAWAAGDIVENRPPLSRWHRDWKDAFAAYMADGG